MSLMTPISLARSHTFRLARKCLHADSRVFGSVEKARSGGSFILKQANNPSVKELNDSDDVD